MDTRSQGPAVQSEREIAVEEQKRLMNVSLVVAVVLLAVKVAAAALTGSSAIYSDAAESVVHLLAVGFAVWALRFSYKPADESHHFGHDKVAFISSGFEGAMISTAALLIFYEAGKQFFYGVQLERLDLGMWLTGSAAAINLILGLSLVRTGVKRGSPVVKANGMHVLTDVWTSVAVLIGLVLIHVTGWVWWDPIIAILAAANILRTGFKLMRESFDGLMDASDPVMEAKVREILDQETAKRGLSYHNFRYRHSGLTHWVEFHLLFDDSVNIRHAHEDATEIEAAIALLLEPDGRVISHLEPRSTGETDEEWEGN